MKLYPHQIEGLEQCKDKNKVAFYWDMGLGKTFGGSEKMNQLDGQVNLIVCQKSKIDDWVEHFKKYYIQFKVFDITTPKSLSDFHGMVVSGKHKLVGVINYDLIFRRSELTLIHIDTLMLDESSLIQNESSKRSKFILRHLSFDNVILLSGTPTNGKYENLWSQLQLLGWNISKDLFWKHYVDFEWQEKDGFPIKVVKGYKNVERLKQKLRDYGAQFLKTEDVLNLPEQIEQMISVPTTKEYRRFKKDSIVDIGNETLIGDTILTQMLYERQLCGHYNQHKLNAFRDILDSTEDRLIVFYNFNRELDELKRIAVEHSRTISIVNGNTKDLEAYENDEHSITFVQYQSGAMGLNLQKANKIVYFSPTLSCGNYMQSKKRIHRINQTRPCFYYYLVCTNSIEERIYNALERGEDFTNELFVETT